MSSNLVFLLKPEEMKGQFADWANCICLAIKVVGVDHQMEFLVFHEDELNNKLLGFTDGLPVVPEVDGFETTRILFSTETQILRMINEEKSFPELSQEYLMNYNWEIDELNSVNDEISQEPILEKKPQEVQIINEISSITEEIKESENPEVSTESPVNNNETIEELYVTGPEETISRSNDKKGVSFGQYYKSAKELINTAYFAKLCEGKLIIASNNSAIQKIDSSLDVLLSETEYSILLPTNNNLKLELSDDALISDSNEEYYVSGVKLSYSVVIDCSDIVQTYGAFVGSEFQRIILKPDSLGFLFKLPMVILNNTSPIDSIYNNESKKSGSNNSNNRSFTHYVSGFVSVLAVMFTVLLYHQVTVSFEKINSTLDQTTTNLNKLNGMTELKSDLNPIYLNSMRDKIVELDGDTNENE